MQVVLLGTAAGGGFPQWNCWCPGCRTARCDPSAAIPRSQSAAAISIDGVRWFLLNVSPDVRDQLRFIRPAEAPRGTRHVPIEGALLTDAELDHSLGIVLLREGGHLPLYATRAVSSILTRDSRLLTTTRAFGEVPVTELELNQPVPVICRDGSPAGISVEAFAVAADPPRFATNHEPGHTVGLLLREDATGKTCAFVPGCGDLDEDLRRRLSSADVLLFDGTFWDDRELIALGVGTRTARQLDHLPISGPEGSLERLAGLPCREKIYTHINNTNPILLERSPERALVADHGVKVGFDGMRIEI